MPAQSFGWSALLALGAVIGAELLIALGLGWLLDTLLGTGPVFLFVGLVVGIAAAVVYAVTEFKKYLKTEN